MKIKEILDHIKELKAARTELEGLASVEENEAKKTAFTHGATFITKEIERLSDVDWVEADK